jgi:hypothetical protein
MNHNIRLLLPGTLLLAGLTAQDVSMVTGPSMGMVFDATRSVLRPIRGIPGAATLGDALPLDFTPSQAWISPTSHFALLERRDNSRLMLAKRNGEALLLSAFADALGAPDLVAFSADGNSGALTYSSDNVILVFAGLPEAPTLVRRIDTAGLPGKSGPIGLSADGSTLLWSVREGEEGKCHRFTHRLMIRSTG